MSTGYYDFGPTQPISRDEAFGAYARLTSCSGSLRIGPDLIECFNGSVQSGYGFSASMGGCRDIPVEDPDLIRQLCDLRRVWWYKRLTIPTEAWGLKATIGYRASAWMLQPTSTGSPEGLFRVYSDSHDGRARHEGIVTPADRPTGKAYLLWNGHGCTVTSAVTDLLVYLQLGSSFPLSDGTRVQHTERGIERVPNS